MRCLVTSTSFFIFILFCCYFHRLLLCRPMYVSLTESDVVTLSYIPSKWKSTAPGLKNALEHEPNSLRPVFPALQAIRTSTAHQRVAPLRRRHVATHRPQPERAGTAPIFTPAPGLVLPQQ